ncbi:hypothetical protein ACQP1G_17400 [Nocardia sp. CA-107356]|uniref:hypothetical protein n=1 Tax=Nocardia sp. CA-107356 TaxID=3239972 RepID=UPI003D9052F3
MRSSSLASIEVVEIPVAGPFLPGFQRRVELGVIRQRRGVGVDPTLVVAVE